MKREKVEGSKQKAVGRNWEERLLRSVVLGFPAMPFDVRKASALPSPVIEDSSSPSGKAKPFRRERGKAAKGDSTPLDRSRRSSASQST